MHLHPAGIAVALLLAVQMAPLAAETLQMPANSGAEAQEGYAVALPTRGMTMRQVEEQFGPPQEKRPPVGDPPITRWIYADYTVYFEYQYVIHAVLKDPR